MIIISNFVIHMVIYYFLQKMIIIPYYLIHKIKMDNKTLLNSQSYQNLIFIIIFDLKLNILIIVSLELTKVFP